MGESAQRIRVGMELRRLRADAELSGQEVATAVGWSQPKLSRIENGRFGVSLSDLTTLLDFYGVSEEVRAELLTVAAEGTGVGGSWVVRAGGPPRRQGEVAAVESRVTRMRQHHPLVIPGQLQARIYARHLAAAAGLPNPEEIARRRAKRQGLLEGPDAPQYDVILDLRTLCRWPGPRRVIVDQVEHLIERAKLPAVHLWLLPVGGGAHSMPLAPFLIYDFRAGTSPTVVLLEAQNTDLYLSAVEDVAMYDNLFAGLLAEALSERESLRRLELLLEEMRKNPKSTPGGVLA